MEPTRFDEVETSQSKHTGAYLSTSGSYSAIRSLHSVRLREREGTAFVFSGGGARGALHVGALRALLEHGVRPDMVVGTSIGAWNAAWTARTPTLEGVEALANAWRELEPAQVLLGRQPRTSFPLRTLGGRLLATAMRRLVSGQPSLYSDTGMRQLLSRYLGDLTFEELAVPLRVIAADLTHGGRAVFDSGPVVPTVLASSAIPGIFPPVGIGDAVYADGGTVDGCSVETAVKMGARRIFVLAIGYDTLGDGGTLWTNAAPHEPHRVRSNSPYSAAAVIQRASQVMGNYQIERALEQLPRTIESHVITLSTATGNGTLKFGNVSDWIERAYTATNEYLSTLGNSESHESGPARESNPATIAC